MIPLPEPAGYRTRYRSEPGMIGHYPWTYADQRRRYADRPEHESEDLFTADQMRAHAAAARRQALEEAMRDVRKALHSVPDEHRISADILVHATDGAIRSLIDKEAGNV